MKIFLLIADGLGDRPSKLLNDMTPLEAANKPNLNKMAYHGMVGLIDPIKPGIIPGSDTSHLNYLGYDPMKYYTGRGPFEALGTGLKLEPGDIAFRANFATVDGEFVVRDRRAGRIRKDTDKLANSLNMEIDGVKIMFKEGTEHRGALVLRGKDLSPEVSENDPHHEGLKVKEIIPLKKEAEMTARILNEFFIRSHEILNSHPVNENRVKLGEPPANAILFRGGGIVPDIPKFRDLHGFSGGFVAAVALVSGICTLAGLKNYTPPGVTGSLDTNIEAKLNAGLDALKNEDFVIVNVKGTDIAGHDGDPVAKMKFIERIDQAIGKVLLNRMDDVLFCFTGDHSTPATYKEHSSDPVPILIYYKGSREDRIENFGESQCRLGTLRLRGNDLMEVLKSHAGKAEKFGA
jgi:2,3-bisphosphoglycerate-independent phosphoglycerate mutase, archaeal form